MTTWQKFKTTGLIIGCVIGAELLLLLMGPLITDAAHTSANSTDAHSALTGDPARYQYTAGALRAFPLWMFFIPPIGGAFGIVITLRKPER